MKKTQASAEYILVSALIILIIVPTIYLFYSYSHKSSEEIRQSQVNKIGTDIVNAAEKIYYLGESSKTTLDAIMPDGVEKIEIWHNQELVFFLSDGTQIPFKSRVNITTDNLCTEQIERCHYNFKKTIYSQGLKHITIESKGDYVIIGGGECAPTETKLCLKQEGVCSGSFETCTVGGTWPGCDDSTYLAWNSSYENPEVTCYDSLDNDCDALTDCNDTINCKGSICTADGSKICVDGPYGPECALI